MKKLSAILAGAMLLSNVAFADTPVKAKDGLGDFLIAPVYFAQGNKCSRIVVYNTNTTHSILAKVAIREQTRSNEVDLPIFLSPGDVWSGTLCERNGDVYLTSKDDSNHPKISNLLANGKNITQQSHKAGNIDVDFKRGYIEIYPIAEFDEGSEKKVDKNILVKRWDMLIKGKYPENTIKSGVDGYSLTGEIDYVSKNTGEITAVLPMTAFKGTHDKVLTGSAIAYGSDTGPDILLGKDKTIKLLKLMQHRATMFTYTNKGKGQYIAFTYPFGYAKDQIRKYKVTIRDMSENKDEKPKEVIIFSPAPKIQTPTNRMENEVAFVSVEELINKTSNPDMFKEGQIQIEDITNETHVQLGKGKRASFIPTFIILKNTKTEQVSSAHYIPTK